MIHPTTAWQEISYAGLQPNLWLRLGLLDIRQRYRRSMLGPFWITLSTAILIAVLGTLWSHLFRMNVRDYLPFFAVGHILWSFINTQVLESANGFGQFEHIVKQVRLPWSVYVLRLLTRNLVVLAHNALILIPVALFTGISLTPLAALAVPGLLLLTTTLFAVSLALAVACTRFRDLPPLVQNVMTVLFFVSPIMWRQDILSPDAAWIAYWNPLAHLIDIVRLPLLARLPTAMNWAVSLGTAVAALSMAFFALKRFRNRIVYWL
jgi:ABC-type polysaccharide/polyol phosphate export permease